LLQVAILALEFTLPLQQRPFGMPIFFFVKGVTVDFGEEIEPVDVGGEGLVFYVGVKADERHELCLQLVEQTKRYASHVGIEGVLVEEVVQILSGDHIGS
jgi:ribosomal protein S7